MVFRLRHALSLFAVVAIVALATLTAPTSGRATTVDQDDGVAVTSTVARTNPIDRAPRVPAGPLLVVGVVAVACVSRTLSRRSGLVGRYRRRIGDVGDDWRSLLFGAPPALA